MSVISKFFGTAEAHEPWVYASEKIANPDARVVETHVTFDDNISQPEMISIDDLPSASATLPEQPVHYGDYTGEKYLGGFGATNIFDLDYWTLRARSRQLFTENLYARGIVRRLVTNEINTGLSVESMPIASILGRGDDAAADWADTTETLFHIWSTNPRLCDYNGRKTWGKIQQDIKTNAYIDGDVLIVAHISDIGLPQIQLISGDLVQNPGVEKSLPRGHEIKHGVQMDADGNHFGYWVDDVKNERSEFIPAVGKNSGRRVAWLYYGTDKLLDQVRGEPLLSIVLQSIKEIDRYRDSAQRKATVNSILAAFIKKGKAGPGSTPFSAGAKRNSSGTVTDSTGDARRFNIAEQVPGVVFETLQEGEEVIAHSVSATDVNFSPFESAILHAIAWANEIPPEILLLAFSSNYSASQAAINEFKMFLNRSRFNFTDMVLRPVYEEWLISMVLINKIEAPGFLQAWQDPAAFDVYGAWISAEFSGAIKPSTDINKQANGHLLMVGQGWSTNARSTRELTGMKWSTNMKILRRENQIKAETMRPMLELKQEFGDPAVVEEEASLQNNILTLASRIDDLEESAEENA